MTPPRSLSRCVLLAIVGLGLATAPGAGAFVVGDDMTGLPQVNQALADARSYWHGSQPSCSAGIRVTVAELASLGEAGRASGCSLELDLTWVNATPSRTQYCALFSHEFGHLLGYGHEDRQEDPDKVMSERSTPRYCRTFGVLIARLPAGCSWPRWARSAPRVRQLYAAGHEHAALKAYRSWRKRHPKTPLPKPCQRI